MQIIKTAFTDFDIYNATVEDWQLQYNILSKSDFKADLNMFTDTHFALSRISLQGKLVHSGKSPEEHRTIVIPINYEDKFIWYNKGSGGNELLVFRKDCKLDAVTFSNFDAYVISIENNFLENIINELDYKNCKNAFVDSELEFCLTKVFAQKFYKLADYFINDYIKDVNFTITDRKKHDKLVNEIIIEILTYIEKTPIKKPIRNKHKKEIALKEAIEIIDNNQGSLYTIKELSILTNVSERSLLYAFKEKYKVSPSEYIKASRLNKVKNELFALKDEDISIATIAGKYNFWHMGQFAKDFKKQFGVLPSEVKNSS
ncbi:MAG: helix-turn-helix domain-containing protein [Flavobacteriaceae bacterium]|nr:helix-turn-helix domain-containing protein [Flavobacteriaceae bacterium]